MFRFQRLRNPCTALTLDEQRKLRQQILDLNLRLSDEESFIANWHARIDTFLETSELLDLAWEGDELVGHFGERTLEVGGERAVYVDNFTVAPRLQRSGLGRRLALRSILRCQLAARGGRFLHVSRTCNPHVAAGVWNALRHPDFYYPSYDPLRPSSPELCDVATKLAAKLWPDKPFDAETGVLVGAYGGDFIPVRPTSHADVARYFEKHVNPERGDAIIQIVRYSPATWGRMARYFAWNQLKTQLRRLGLH